MKFLIDTRDGQTITAELANCSQPYPYVNRIDVGWDDDAVSLICILSTARSLEAEALKEARELIGEYVSLAEQSSHPPTLANLKEWLEKWGRA